MTLWLFDLLQSLFLAIGLGWAVVIPLWAWWWDRRWGLPAAHWTMIGNGVILLMLLTLDRWVFGSGPEIGFQGLLIRAVQVLGLFFGASVVQVISTEWVGQRSPQPMPEFGRLAWQFGLADTLLLVVLVSLHLGCARAAGEAFATRVSPVEQFLIAGPIWTLAVPFARWRGWSLPAVRVAWLTSFAILGQSILVPRIYFDRGFLTTTDRAMYLTTVAVGFLVLIIAYPETRTPADQPTADTQPQPATTPSGEPIDQESHARP